MNNMKRLDHAIETLRSTKGRDCARQLGEKLLSEGYSVFWGTEDDENKYVEFDNGEDFSVKVTDAVI